MTADRITKELIIEMMEQISPVPDRIRALPEDIFAQNIALNVQMLVQVIDHDLGEIDDYLRELNEHLAEVDHTFDSPCWKKRAEALQVQAVLNQKKESVERLAIALRQFLNPEPLN